MNKCGRTGSAPPASAPSHTYVLHLGGGAGMNKCKYVKPSQMPHTCSSCSCCGGAGAASASAAGSAKSPLQPRDIGGRCGATPRFFSDWYCEGAGMTRRGCVSCFYAWWVRADVGPGAGIIAGGILVRGQGGKPGQRRRGSQCELNVASFNLRTGPS